MLGALWDDGREEMVGMLAAIFRRALRDEGHQVPLIGTFVREANRSGQQVSDPQGLGPRWSDWAQDMLQEARQEASRTRNEPDELGLMQTQLELGGSTASTGPPAGGAGHGQEGDEPPGGALWHHYFQWLEEFEEGIRNKVLHFVKLWVQQRINALGRKYAPLGSVLARTLSATPVGDLVVEEEVARDVAELIIQDLQVCRAS